MNFYLYIVSAGMIPTNKLKGESIMAKEYRVNVYDNEYCEGGVIARVRYNATLDYWDGRNWTNGGTGMHKGLTKLKDGRYVFIIGSQWTGSKDYGYVVDAEEVLDEILKSGNTELLDTKKYAELKGMYNELMTEYEEGEE